MEVFRGTCIVANFFKAILRARNGIPAIKLLVISKTSKLEFFSYFWNKYGLFWGCSAVLASLPIFLQLFCVLEMVFRQKIIGDLKNGEIRFFFVFLEQIRVVLGVFRGALGVPNFFVVSLCARNCIPAIKLLAISKTAKLEFFSYFWSK